jgi:hypothetical protein
LDSVAQLRSLKWAGEGANIYADEIKARAISEGIEFCRRDSGTILSGNEEQWVLINSPEVLALSVARLALARVRGDNTLLSRELAAIYVRPSDAKLSV